jgi:hypothetical protein
LRPVDRLGIGDGVEGADDGVEVVARAGSEVGVGDGSEGASPAA